MKRPHNKLKQKDLLGKRSAELVALEEMLRCIRKCAPALAVPQEGWVRAVREALGVTNVQIASRLGKAPQSIEDMQKSEAAGSIKLQSLRTLAEGLGCQLVYAIVPPKSLAEMRDEHAWSLVERAMKNAIDATKGGVSRQKAIERMVEKVLAGSPRAVRK